MFLVPSHSLQAISILLIFSTAFSQGAVKCPSSLCFCTKATASRICSNPLIVNDCEVKKCINSDCSGKGYSCGERSKSEIIVPDFLVEDLRKQIQASGGCKNNICFSIDGSSSINPADYKTQLSFVENVILIIDNAVSKFDVRVTGTQYSDKSYPIVTNLSENLGGFLNEMKKQSQVRRNTAISEGLDFCLGQLKASTTDEPKSVVVLGDGKSNAGTDPVVSANRLRDISALVSIVGVGIQDRDFLNRIAGGDKNLAFQATKSGDPQRLVNIIRDVTLAICRVK